MTNHPHRPRRKDAPAVPFHLPAWLRDRSRGKNPSHVQMRKLRQMHVLTKPEMAALLHVSLRAYEEWESGRTKMHANHWLAMRCACHEHRKQQQREAEAIRNPQ